jgi:hypothetical protein
MYLPLALALSLWRVLSYVLTHSCAQVRNMIVGRRGTAVCLSLRRLILDPRSGDTLRYFCVCECGTFIVLSACQIDTEN